MKVTYAFFECEGCGRGFSVGDTPGDPVEEPICPAPGCGSEMARFVGNVDLPIPLPIKLPHADPIAEIERLKKALEDVKKVCKDSAAYTNGAKAYHIAHKVLEVYGDDQNESKN